MQKDIKKGELLYRECCILGILRLLFVLQRSQGRESNFSKLELNRIRHMKK